MTTTFTRLGLSLLAASCVVAHDQYVMGVAPTTTATEPDWFKTRPQSFQGNSTWPPKPLDVLD